MSTEADEAAGPIGHIDYAKAFEVATGKHQEASLLHSLAEGLVSNLRSEIYKRDEKIAELEDEILSLQGTLADLEPEEEEKTAEEEREGEQT